MAKLRPLHTVPPYLYKTETIQRFQNRLREAFLSGDCGTARVYLQNLVDHIVIGEVLADVVDWRPNGDGSENLRLVVPNPQSDRHRRHPNPAKRPKSFAFSS